MGWAVVGMISWVVAAEIPTVIGEVEFSPVILVFEV